MCGRYTLTSSDLGAVAAELAAEIDPALEHHPRFNIAPTQLAPIVRPAGDRPLLTLAKWGLELSGRPVINLRSETASKRAANPERRCIVPADGFYEWVGDKAHRRPIWFHRPDGELLYLGGLTQGAGYCILTTKALAPVAEIHDRMPVIFGAEHARAWLTGEAGLRPDAIELAGREVSPRANSARNDDPGLLETS